MHAKAEKAEVAVTKAPRFYPAEDAKKPLNRSFVRNPTKLRASITPGTVLILLAGRFKGKRVVFLKQLPSGLLLVTGPFRVNGVPARRVNQAYVIATSTKVDVSGVDTAAFTDAYFKSTEKKTRKSKGEAEFFEDKLEKAALPAEYIANQKAVDASILSGLRWGARVFEGGLGGGGESEGHGGDGVHDEGRGSDEGICQGLQN